ESRQDRTRAVEPDYRKMPKNKELANYTSMVAWNGLAAQSVMFTDLGWSDCAKVTTGGQDDDHCGQLAPALKTQYRSKDPSYYPAARSATFEVNLSKWRGLNRLSDH